VIFVGVVDMNEVDEAEIEEAINHDLLPSGFVDEFPAAQNYNEMVDGEVPPMHDGPLLHRLCCDLGLNPNMSIRCSCERR